MERQRAADRAVEEKRRREQREKEADARRAEVEALRADFPAAVKKASAQRCQEPSGYVDLDLVLDQTDGECSFAYSTHHARLYLKGNYALAGETGSVPCSMERRGCLLLVDCTLPLNQLFGTIAYALIIQEEQRDVQGKAMFTAPRAGKCKSLTYFAELR